MNTPRAFACATFALCLTCAPAAAPAQTVDAGSETAGARIDAPHGFAAEIDSEPPVTRLDLSGPRLGFTFLPSGDPRSQFGWHFEHQVSSGRQGPAFLVETVLLAGGMESHAFVPNGSLIFGVRVPSGFELGVGPSVTLGGSRGLKTAIVFAAGQSFRVGGIRVPVNFALASERDGQRISIVTGWAVRDRVTVQ